MGAKVRQANDALNSLALAVRLERQAAEEYERKVHWHSVKAERLRKEAAEHFSAVREYLEWLQTWRQSK